MFEIFELKIEYFFFCFLLQLAFLFSSPFLQQYLQFFMNFLFILFDFQIYFLLNFFNFRSLNFLNNFLFFVALPAATTAIVHESKFSNAIQGNQIELIKTIQFHLITLLIAIFLMKIYRFFLLCQKLAKILCRKMLHYAIPQVAVTF